MPWRAYVREHPTFGTYYARVERQPGWVVRLTLLAAVLVIVVPLMILTLAAVLTAGVVFVLASLVARVASLFTRGPRDVGPTDDGRENVRVIERP